MKRSSIRRRLSQVFVWSSLVLLAFAAFVGPALAAPETPQVNQGHGTLAVNLYTWPGGSELEPVAEYGLTDRLAVRTILGDVRHDESLFRQLAVKYEIQPNLAVEGFFEPWPEGQSASGFGVFFGQQFGPLYASVRWQAVGLPYLGERLWVDQVRLAGSYALGPHFNLLGAAEADLEIGTDWHYVYGLEWQVNRNLAAYVNHHTRDGANQLGLEYRF
ncbi:MAG: hypothetical protein ACM3XZ_03265 [Betaproteobacteria bacterium]